MRYLIGAALAILLVGCQADDNASRARSEVRRARIRAFLAPRNPSALVRLGRAQLQVWNEEEAAQAFGKAYRTDPRCAPAVGDAYFEAAKAIAARGPTSVARVPLVARYAEAASRWSQRVDARRWYFEQVARVLPELDPDHREMVYKMAARIEVPEDAWGLRHFVATEMAKAERSNEYGRWFALTEIADHLTARSDVRGRAWVAQNYAVVAKRIGTDDRDVTRHAVARAQELDSRWSSDYELLDLRSRIDESGGPNGLSAMQRTANSLIQITVSATKYSRQRGGFPPCGSIHEFVGAIQRYATETLPTSDAWGNTLRCSTTPYGLYLLVESPGPDGAFDRGESISAWDAMHMTDTPEQADIYVEHGYIAPPWWTREQVLSLYGQ